MFLLTIIKFFTNSFGSILISPLQCLHLIIFSKTISHFKVSKQELTRIKSFTYQEGLSIQDIEEIFEFLEIQKGVQYIGNDGLLKIMDRDVVEVDRGQGFSERQIMFDTSNLTIIFMGAFEDLYKTKEQLYF